MDNAVLSIGSAEIDPLREVRPETITTPNKHINLLETK